MNLERPNIQAGADSLRAHFALRGQRVSVVDATMLSESPPERYVVRYRVEIEAEGEETCWVVGKFDYSGAGARSCEIMQRIRAAISSANSGDVHSGDDRPSARATLAVPEPWYYVVGLQCLFLPYIDALPASPHDTPACLNTCRLAGKALSELHGLPLLPGPTLSVQRQLFELLSPHPMELARVAPKYREPITRLLDQIQGAAEVWRWPATVVHRDFQLRQMLLVGQKLWLLDWDQAANGDPALDLAYFLGYLHTHLPTADAEQARSEFWRAYFDRAPNRLPAQDQTPLMERLELYLRFNFLRRACRRFRLRDQNWRAQMTEMLEAMSDHLLCRRLIPTGEF